MSSVLIVKTSSLGDILQSFPVLDFLHDRLPGVAIDWAVTKELAPVVAAHPLIRHAIPVDHRGDLAGSLKRIREKQYDLLFDLQGNCKSGLFSLFARAKKKVGFGFKTAREWPAALAVEHRIEVPRELNIRLFYLEPLRRFFNDSKPFEINPTLLSITAEERAFIQGLLLRPELASKPRIMVCPGSKWQNKQLPLETMQTFLAKVADTYGPSFLLMWGSPDEKKYCQTLQEAVAGRSLLIDKLPLPVWQNLMAEVDLLIAVDSSALHLAATTQTPSFSLFGPTSPSVFKPLGDSHFALHGPCPYNQMFTKQCPLLRTCPTGACIKNLGVNEIFASFQDWWLLKN